MKWVKHMVWSMSKSPFTTTGSYQKDGADNLVEKPPDVETEYVNAFRTQSYVDIQSEIQRLETQSSAPSLPPYIHLSECLLEPRQETLITMIEGSKMDNLVFNFFEACLAATNACESLLRSIHQIRSNYRTIKRGIKSFEAMINSDNHRDKYRVLFGEIKEFLNLKNPFLSVEFGEIHSTHVFLYHELMMKSKKIKRTVKLARFVKKAMACTLVVTYGGLALTLLVLGLHTMVGTLAMPGLIACATSFLKKKKKMVKGGFKKRSKDRIGEQLDVAARGIFTLINDLDTMSRLVTRLSDEIDDGKDIAAMCLRNGKNRRVMKKLLRELRNHEICLSEGLEELEKHVCLCVVTINRSRLLVLQEIMEIPSECR